MVKKQDFLPENLGIEINGISHRAKQAETKSILLSPESVKYFDQKICGI